MIHNFLLAKFSSPGPVEIIVVLLLLGLSVLVILGLIRLAQKGFIREQKLNRMEVGKLADEVQQMQQKINNRNDVKEKPPGQTT